MAFFLSGNPSNMPLDSLHGGYLGLFNGTAPYGPAQFVAIEFDSYRNDWDPINNHIGININSVVSWNTTSLISNTSLNGIMTAIINFNSSTGMLVASLHFPNDDNSSTEPFEVSYVLPDPKTLFPPEVAVGFSASNGAFTELHQILAWSFNSTIPATTTRKGMSSAFTS
jgi:hypothetical protein